MDEPAPSRTADAGAPAPAVPPLPPSGATAGDADATLKSRFGHEGFRPRQREAVDAALRGEDVFVLMPTGGGKSLCYQLPAVMTRGTTVVVSPLIALMEDQVRGLWANGVSAALLHSGLDAAESNDLETRIERGEFDLVYLSPERLVGAKGRRLLRAMLRRGAIDRFAIDEAHCISEWGHDFRPEYRRLGELRDDPESPLAQAPMLALTATATPRVAADVVAQLRLRDPVRIELGFERSNLHYAVRPKRGAFEHIASYLEANPRHEGIVYCNSRAKTEQTASKLRERGVDALAYHAGMDHADRRAAQEAFTFGRTRVCVATVAFGMGVDKPDVRFVFHLDPPRHLEGYYQQTGRAGRDGLPADCVMFYSPADVARLRGFLDEIESPDERAVAEGQLREVVRFAVETKCRMPRLLGYFGEHHPGDCGHCDNCLHPPEHADRTLHARMLLSAVARTEQRFGLSHVVDVLRGSRSQKVRQHRHDRLSVHGIGKDQSKSFWLQLADGLIERGELALSTDGFRIATLTAESKPVLRGQARVELARARPSPMPRDAPATHAAATTPSARPTRPCSKSSAPSAARSPSARASRRTSSSAMSPSARSPRSSPTTTKRCCASRAWDAPSSSGMGATSSASSATTPSRTIRLRRPSRLDTNRRMPHHVRPCIDGAGRQTSPPPRPEHRAPNAANRRRTRGRRRMIQVDSLTKWYGPTRAVDNVSFEIPKGEIVGFLGPNGAGKSTTLRMVTGYLPPSGGRASIDGHDVMNAPRAARLRIGYLPESTPLYEEMRVTEYLHYRGRLYDMPRKRRRQRIDAVVDRCGLDAYRRRTIGRLSKGNRQRVGLAQALLHEPPVLILDEPTAGLDPNQITAVRGLIDELKGNHTILLSSHILPEVEKTADRVVIISGGRLVADGTPAALRERIAADAPVVLEVRADAAEVESALSGLAEIESVRVEARDGWTVARAAPASTAGEGAALEAVGRVAVSKGWPLRGLRRDAGSLEDFFTQVTAAPPRSAA